jgi:hypothetical protein
MNPKQAENSRRQRDASLPPSRHPEPEWHDRRTFLRGIGHAGLTAVSARTLGASMLGSALAPLRSDRANAAREPLIQPPEIRSWDGVLNATFTAAQDRMRLGEYEFPGFLYNDSYLPPLLRVRLGDIMRIEEQLIR